MSLPTFDDVREARRRIDPWIHRTPVLTSDTLDRMSGARLFFKCENFQKAGAFKARGASNAVFSLTNEQAARGVATHSSGNHAQALSRAAACRGIAGMIVMPETANRSKMAAVRDYGGELYTCEPTLAAREQALAELVERTGAHFVHPYNDAQVIAGQGTCAMELLEQIDGLDALVAPIGGGGLISGTALACAALAPETRIYAAEPANADDAQRSLHAGRIVDAGTPHTVADGLKTSLGDLTFHFVSQYVNDVLLAFEEEIIAAMRLIWERMKLVIEPSCAVPLAAILRHPEIFRGECVGVMLTGGNVDLNRLPWLERQ